MLTFNFSELKEQTATLVQRSGDSDYKSDIGAWLNLSLLTLYNSYDYWLELRNRHNFTTGDGTALYYMPSDFDKPLRFYDITNDRVINVKTEEEYTDANIGNTADSTEGDVDTAYFTEVVGVKVQVSTSGGTIQAKSSSSSDVHSSSLTRQVTVEGYLDSGLTILGVETINLNGTTAVAGTTTFYKITNFSKSGDTTGYITLENSSATTLATLGQYERVARYKAFRLGLIPDDSTTNMRVLYKKRMKRLVSDGDYPFVECDDYLIFNSVALSLQQDKETIERAVMMQQMSKMAMKEILTNQMSILGPSYQHKIVSSMAQAHRF